MPDSEMTNQSQPKEAAKAEPAKASGKQVVIYTTDT